MTSQESPQKRYSLFGLAVLLLLFAGATFVMASTSFAIHSLGVVAILVSVWLVRVSKVRGRPGNRVAGIEGTKGTTSKRLGVFVWAAGAGSLLAEVASYIYLRNDTLNGYHQVLPVYIFAGVGLACALIWGYIALKLLQ
jgi:hypothetical protein